MGVQGVAARAEQLRKSLSETGEVYSRSLVSGLGRAQLRVEVYRMQQPFCQQPLEVLAPSWGQGMVEFAYISGFQPMGS